MCALLKPREPAPKRVRGEAGGRDGRTKQQQQRRGSRQQGGAGGERQGNGKWNMPGFSANPGGRVMATGSYIVKSVQS